MKRSGEMGVSPEFDLDVVGHLMGHHVPHPVDQRRLHLDDLGGVDPRMCFSRRFASLTFDLFGQLVGEGTQADQGGHHPVAAKNVNVGAV